MRGYRALRYDGISKDGNITGELGKKYTVSGEVKMGENGFHFHENLEDVHMDFFIKDARIFEVEADGKIIQDKETCCAESITMIRELTIDEVRNYFIENKERILDGNCGIRLEAAELGVCLEDLVVDKYPIVREAVADHGYGLDRLIFDGDSRVSRVAKKKFADSCIQFLTA